MIDSLKFYHATRDRIQLQLQIIYFWSFLLFFSEVVIDHVTDPWKAKVPIGVTILMHLLFHLLIHVSVYMSDVHGGLLFCDRSMLP